MLPQEHRSHWAAQIKSANWRAVEHLYQLLQSGTLNAQLFLLTDGEYLLSFCTLARQDEIQDDSLFPWIGYVYTFPDCRGHRYSEQIIRHACTQAKAQGHLRVYLSSNERGLYEKYGFTFWKTMQTIWDEETQVFIRELSDIGTVPL